MNDRHLERAANSIINDTTNVIESLKSEIESLEAEVDELNLRLDEKEEKRYALWEELEELKNS